MRYSVIGQVSDADNIDDNRWTVRMFMDDGRTFDETFQLDTLPTLESVLDAVVAPRMNELLKAPPSDQDLADPAVPIEEVAGVEVVPASAVEVAIEDAVEEKK